MINFKEIDGVLYRMLEEPTPLTLDAQFPCLVRLIQDDSPMGRNNRYCFVSCLEQTYEIKQLTGEDVKIENGLILAHHTRFEIIGYPVADGSHYWALYQMMQGKLVCNPELAKAKADITGEKQSRYNLKWHRISHNCFAIVNGHYAILSAEEWVELSYHTGWTLYEPEEPAEVPPPKEPDYIHCTRCGGSGYEIAPEPSIKPLDVKVKDWTESKYIQEEEK